MDRDRGAALILQAAYKGLIDFSEARFSDRAWWQKLRLMLDKMEDDNLSQVQQMQFQLNTSVLSYQSEEQQLKHHWQKAQDLITSRYDALFSWSKQATGKDAIQKVYKGLIDEWERHFGDRNDPKVVAMLEEYKERVRQMQQGTKTPTTPTGRKKRNKK